MASWFYASEGKQQGPYQEAQFRDLIAQGVVRADTLVWSEGMAGWQKAAEIPGLIGSAGGPPPMIPQGGPPVASGTGLGGGAISIDLPLWSFLGRVLLLVIGSLLVIPAPWTATGYYRWLFPRFHVPGRPNLAFTGQPLDIWYVFIALGLLGYVGFIDNTLQLVGTVVQAFLSWMIMRWVVANISSNGQPLPLAFNGSVLVFIGYQILMFISFITIIGWAWVITAWMRWICRNITGSRREIVFNGTGLQVLWRTLVFGIGCSFIIPIPWVLRWYTKWYVSQLALVERGAMARA